MLLILFRISENSWLQAQNSKHQGIGGKGGLCLTGGNLEENPALMAGPTVLWLRYK